MQISKEQYGTLKDGREIQLFTLINKAKVKVQVEVEVKAKVKI